MRKWSLASAFNQCVRMDITTMHRTPARRLAFTAPDISTTGSSWAWARGRAGAMATAGAAIALLTMVEGAITVEVERRPSALMRAASRQAVLRQSGPTRDPTPTTLPTKEAHGRQQVTLKLRMALR